MFDKIFWVCIWGTLVASIVFGATYSNKETSRGVLCTELGGVYLTNSSICIDENTVIKLEGKQ